MAPTGRRRPPTWILALALAAAGTLLTLYAWTGTRVYHLVWFYVSLLGLAAAIVGFTWIGFDRAIRPELERRRARGLPPPPTFRERARSLVTDPVELPPAPGKRAAAAKPRGKVERIRMSCPSCAQIFTAEGVRPLAVTCPRCGLEGELP